MRVLVTGAGGQLGRELVEAFETSGHQVDGRDRARLDVTSRDQVLAAVTQLAPDAVIHAGAWTDVDGCEADPDRAFGTNGLGTRYVAEAARRVGASVCYLSSDYVFGNGPTSVGPGGASHVGRRPLQEWDVTRPDSVYGRSKLAGESELTPGDMVVRTSWLCGKYGRNFVKTILGRAQAGERSTVVDDQHGCPTFADDLAGMICRLVIERRAGIFHVTNQGPTTWFGLAQAVVAAAGLNPALVNPSSTASMVPDRPAPRPAWSVLDNLALRLGGIALLPDFHEPLERLVKDLMTVGVVQ